MGSSNPHVIGFDDAPFPRRARGRVLLVGAAFCGTRLEGVLSGRIRRDGVNATRVIGDLVTRSRFAPHLHAVLLQGITMAGFNVVDLPRLHRHIGRPVIAVTRHRPNLAAIRHALLEKVPGGRRKWRLIEQLCPMQSAAGVYIQPVGIGLSEATELVNRLAFNGRIPEPLRTAHLIATGMGAGESRQRV